MNHLAELSRLPSEALEYSSEPEKTPRESLKAWNMLKSIARAASWMVDKAKSQQSRKILKLCESVPLGDKRFVAVLQVEHERFLIGGAPSSVSLLARLEPKSFSEALRNSRNAGERA